MIEGELVFKQTEIGLIPEDWEVVRLGEVAAYINGYAFKPSNWKQRGKPIIRIQNLNDKSKPYNYYAGVLPDKYAVKEGDLLISWSASLGAFLWKGEDAWLNQHIFKVVPKQDVVDKNLLFFLVNHSMTCLKKKPAEPTMKHVVKEDFLNSEIPPPISEQRKIAKVLSTIQRAIEQQDKIIEATRKLKRSLLQKLFAEGLNGEEQKETEIGLIPKSWEVVRLGEILAFSKKPRDLKLNSFERIPFITMEMIPAKKIYINEYLLKEPNEISSEVYCEKGDILLPKITPCFENGKQGIVEDIPYDFAFATTEVYPLKPKNDLLDKMFLFYFLTKFDVRKEMADKMQGATGRQRVPKDAVENTLIPFPPVLEQRKIAYILSTVDKKIEVEERRKATLKELFRTMLHKLMTREIRVKDTEL